MTTNPSPAPGDFMVVATPGWQAHAIRLITRSPVNHAVLMTEPGRVIEEDPGGAREDNLSNYDGMFQRWSNLLATDQERDAVVAAARTHLGVGYSWLDDACIGLADLLGWRVPTPVRSRLCRPDRLMCSQLVDTAYKEAGFSLFKDGRIPGDVAPGDLLDIIEGRKPSVGERW